MNREALENLARVVRHAPEELFHMQAVVSHPPCGTARCAIGWAIVDPWFRENTELGELVPIDYDGVGFYGFDTDDLAHLFGITEKDANKLFMVTGYFRSAEEHPVSRAEVLWNIKQLLDGKHARPYRAILGSTLYPAYLRCAGEISSE